MERQNRQRIPYWPWIPAAFALSGIVLFIFASYGPPASSSGFVSTLNGLFAWIAPEYAASKAHYRAIPGPGSWLFTFVLGMAIGGFIAGRTSKEIPVRDMPPIWKQRFGKSRVKRYATTFFAGISAMQNKTAAMDFSGFTSTQRGKRIRVFMIAP